jgi:hypothetical protein
LEGIDSSISGPKTLPDDKMAVPDPQVLIEERSRLHNLRMYEDFPVNEEILNFMKETIIIIDFSFQNMMNNIKSAEERCHSASIGRLLNTNIGSNPVTGVKNYFNDLTSISLVCHYACASDVTTVYKWVSTNDLYARSPNAPSERDIPTIRKLTRDILNYDKNGILLTPHAHERGCRDKFGKTSIPFVEVIEL